jgi:transcriptional antiterminator NusG
MLNSQDSQWYAVRTQSRYEKVVRDQLVGRGIDCLLPLCTRMSQWKDRRKRIAWPLFSGYCFGRFALEQQRQVIQASGVVEIVGSGQVAEPIPADEVAAIQRLTQSEDRYETYPYDLQEGMRVTVVRGSLQGLHGRFIRTAAGGRLVLTVNLIQQAASIDIAAEDVAPADEQPVLTPPSPAL